jgi:hypothetical protein
MYHIIQTILLSSIILLILIFLVFGNRENNANSFSSYYNTEGAFAGFIQKKNNLFRACEFSSNGSVLSCSKWFDDNNLTQGQNKGITEEQI